MPIERPAGKRLWILAALIGVAVIVAVPWLKRESPPVPKPPVREALRSTATRQNGLLVLNGESAPFTGKLIESHSDGSRKLEMTVRDGRLDGLTRGWFPGGKPEISETFTADHSEGVRVRWYPNGEKRSEATILHGVLQGSYTEWHDNGVKSVSMTLADGKGEGLAEAWYPSGILKSRTNLKHGEVVTREYFEDQPSSP